MIWGKGGLYQKTSEDFSNLTAVVQRQGSLRRGQKTGFFHSDLQPEYLQENHISKTLLSNKQHSLKQSSGAAAGGGGVRWGWRGGSAG